MIPGALRDQLAAAWGRFFTLDLRKVDWPRTILLVCLVLAIAAALWQYFMPQVRVIEATTFKKVPQIQKVAEVKRVYVPCPQQGVVALDKAEVAKKLGMAWLQEPVPDAALGEGLLAAGAHLPPAAPPAAEPAPIPGNPQDLQVTGTAELPDSDTGYQVVSVFDTQTGETNLVAKEKPAPWFAFENRGSLGLWYGYDHKLAPTLDASGQWTFLRVLGAHLGLRGEAGTGGGRIQAGILYQW